MGLGRSSPGPGCGVAIEMLRRDLGHVGNVMIIRQRLPSEGLAPEDAPPSLNQVEPGGTHRDEGVLDAGMSFQPLPDRATAMAGEVVGNQVKVPRWVGPIHGLEHLQIAGGIPGTSRLGERVPIADAEGCIDPDFLWPSVVVERDLDAVPVGGPAGRRWEIARRYQELQDPARQRRGPWRPRAGRCRGRRSSLFWDEVRIRILARRPQPGTPPGYAASAPLPGGRCAALDCAPPGCRAGEPWR